jgi:hypothetical protein
LSNILKLKFFIFVFQTLAGEEITFSYITHRSLQDDMLTIHNKLELNWQIVCPEGNITLPILPN